MVEPFVSAWWLRANRDRVVLADTRSRDAYNAGHLPGAVFADEATDLSDPPSDAGGRHPLPSPDRFAQSMAALGIGDDSVVVAYDDAGGVIAARLAWMLRALGKQAAILDGGIAAGDRPLSTEPVTAEPAHFTPAPWPTSLLAGAADAADRSLVVIDARPGDRYAGEPDALDPRAGHIPGARSLPCRENLSADGTLLPVEVLARRFAAAGVTADADVVSYCGSGVTACHNILVMEHLGLGTARLYPGSWSAWSRDPSLPAATGDQPG